MSTQAISPEEKERLAGIRLYKTADLISYRDETQFSNADMEAEMARVYEATAIERKWCKDLTPFETDSEILEAAEKGRLVRVQPDIGIMPIQRLVDYTPERANPEHKWHYSPPFLKPEAWRALQFIGVAFNRIQVEDRAEPFLFLPVTSLTRGNAYQSRLTTKKGRKVAIDTNNTGDRSSHECGLAFDIDGGGLYRYDPVQRVVTSINPRTKAFDAEAELVAHAREDLRGILDFLKDRGDINYVEEVPGTKEWCFHICARPE
ncbi:MAG: DUF5715 family protein [Candidatus Saccharimonadales bacterium]